MYMFLLWYVEYLMCSACPLQFSFIEHALTSVSAVLMVLAFWDTVQISSVTPSFTLEEPLGLLIMRMKSNFYTKLSKHLTGLCPQEQYWYCPQQKSLQCLLISQLILFWKVTLHWTVWINNFLYSIISAEWPLKVKVLLVLSYIF